MNFYYYNLNHNKKKDIFFDGKIVDIDNLIDFYKKNNKEIFNKSNTLISLKIKDINVNFDKNKKEWISFFCTVIYVITGCIPNEKDKTYFKSIYYKLKEKSKESINIKNLLNSKKFVFICLPYLVSGFYINKNGLSSDGNNNFKNLFSFLEEIVKKNISVSTFFCAHREKEPELVEELDYESISISCNLILGIIKNISENFIERDKILCIYQPDSSVFGISSIFPEIFLNYTNNNRLGELIIKINDHFNNLSYYLNDKYGGEVVLYDLIKQKKETIKKCKEFFGSDFLKINDLFEVKKNIKDEYLYYIIEDINKKIIRLMPFYKEGIYISNQTIENNKNNSADFINKIDNIKDVIEESILDFKSIKSVVNKSIYEAMFYISWGERAKKNNEIIIGLERDHKIYQTMAITYGYNLYNINYYNSYSIPLLFAKREKRNKFIKFSKLSFRQFFRLSEKITF